MVSALWLHGVLAVSNRFCRNEKGRHENGGLRINYPASLVEHFIKSFRELVRQVAVRIQPANRLAGDAVFINDDERR
jgi:hypothetical protein